MSRGCGGREKENVQGNSGELGTKTPQLLLQGGRGLGKWWADRSLPSIEVSGSRRPLHYPYLSENMVSRAIVAGGGIGGIPAAIALCKAGFEVKVGIPDLQVA